MIHKPVSGAADPSGAIPAAALTGSAEAPADSPSLPSRPGEEKTVTVKEAAYRLGKSTDAIYQWLRSGRLRGRQPGGRCCAILVLESSIDEALLFTFERASAGRSSKGFPWL